MDYRQIRKYQREFFDCADCNINDLERMKNVWTEAKEYINVNHQNIGYDENSVLSSACLIGNVEMVEFLLSIGANVNSINEYEETPIFLAMEQRSVECLKLLINSGADINHQNATGQTVLHRLVKFSINIDNKHLLSLVSILINAGIDLHIKDDKNNSALDLVFDDEVKNFIIEEHNKFMDMQIKTPEDF